MTLSVRDFVAKIMSFVNAKRGLMSISDMHLAIVYVLYCIHKKYSVPTTSFFNLTPESKNDKLYNDLSEASRRNQSRNSLADLYSFCHRISTDYCDFFDNNYVSILQEINKAFSSDFGIKGGIFFTPEEVSILIAHFLDKEGCKSIFDPFCGTASIIHYLQTPNDELCFEGQDFDQDISLIARVNIEARTGLDSGIKCTDSIREWNEKHFDAVCSCPPFGLKITPDPVLEEEFHTSHVYLEKLIFDRAFRYNSAKVVILLEPMGFAFREGGEKELRKGLVDSNILDTIIALPSNILNGTGIPSMLMICKNNREEGMPITFIDASNNFTKKDRIWRVLDTKAILDLIQHPDSEKCIQVNKEEVREHEYTFAPSSYITSKSEEFPDGYQVLELKDIVESIPQNRKYGETEGRIVTISQIFNDATDCERTPEDFEVSSELKNAYKLEEPALLLSTIGKLKAAYCKASGENPLFVHPHVKAFRLTKGWVNPAYLCLQLYKSKGYNVGAVIPHINLSEMLRIKVAFPSIGKQQSFDEQERLYREYKESTKLAKAKEMGLQEVIDKMKAEYINVIRSRKHDMKPYVRELGSFERMIRHYVSKKDEMPDFSEKMIVLLDKHYEALTKLSEFIDVFSEEQQFGKPEQFNINKYLIELEANHDKMNGYWIEYDRDDDALSEYGIPVGAGVSTENFEPIDSDSEWGKEIMAEANKFSVIVDINHLDFERLVRNIIENAINHGFTDPNRSDYGIRISLSVDFEKRMFQIDFSNNGTPLPSGMDKQRYGLLGEKAGMTGRTGRGGYIIKSIVEHYHGDYDVFKEGENTVIRILLPIANYDYENE